MIEVCQLQHRFLKVVVLSLSLLQIGCGDGTDKLAVGGTVTYQGKALPGGSITFYPTSGRPINGIILPDGTYKLDLAPGEYVVGVTHNEPLPPGFKEGDPIPPAKIVLPQEYSTSAKSTLKAFVAADQSEPINFDL